MKGSKSVPGLYGIKFWQCLLLRGLLLHLWCANCRPMGGTHPDPHATRTFLTASFFFDLSTALSSCFSSWISPASEHQDHIRCMRKKSRLNRSSRVAMDALATAARRSSNTLPTNAPFLVVLKYRWSPLQVAAACGR